MSFPQRLRRRADSCLRALSLALGSLLAGTTCPGQLLIAPEHMFLTNTGSSSLTWRTTGGHFQLFYDASIFLNQGVVGPVRIDRLRFRPAMGISQLGGMTFVGDGSTRGVNLSIGTSAVDLMQASTVFAANRGAMQQVLRHATVQVSASTGGLPNDSIIDVPIPGGFVYDPTSGEDLLVEIDTPAVSGGVMPMMATSHLLSQGCRRLSSGNQQASYGTFSSFANVILFDVSGGPGGVATVEPALSTVVGRGCQRRARSFGQQFPGPAPAFDLPLGSLLRMTPDVPFAPTRYDVTLQQGAVVVPPAGQPVMANDGMPMADDSISQPLDFAAAFTFPFVGGATSVVHASSNGYVELQPTTASFSPFDASLADLVAGPPRLCPAWTDLDPMINTFVNASAGVYFDVDAAGGSARISWLDVGEAATPWPGAVGSTFQVELFADGSVEFRYGAMGPFSSPLRDIVVGFSPGGGLLEPFSLDLDHELPYSTSPTENQELSLAADAPVLGDVMALSVNGIPFGAPIGAQLLSVTRLPGAGFDLAAVGAVGCRQYLDPAASNALVFFGGPTAVRHFAIPGDPAFLNAVFHGQAAAFDPASAGGLVTSNALRFEVGTVR
jgi:hypothetical protein